ncbi:MAG: hypothetical protein C0444_09705 [Microbacterium sp.]|nr:hypothetical protein [Microbacterium sp.]MBA4345070.1 hypothetical protein [Microbacterium sp.]
MGAELNNIPQLDGWVNLTEAAEMLGITRQHAFKKVRQANDGHPSGWRTIRRVGSKPMYVISTAEIADLQSASDSKTDLMKGTLSRADRELWLRNHRLPDSTTDEDILMAMGSGFN